MQEWLIGGAAIGALAMLWGHVKSAWAMAKSLVVTTIFLDPSDLTEAMAAYLWRNASKRPFGQPTYKTVYIFSKKENKYVSALFEKISKTGTTIFWKGWRPIIIHGGNGTSSRSSGQDEPSSDRQLQVSFLRGTFVADELLLEAMRWNHTSNSMGNGRFCVYVMSVSSSGDDGLQYHSPRDIQPIAPWRHLRPVGHDYDDLGATAGPSAKRKLAMTDEMDEALAESRRWFKSKQWYVERGVPWRRGLLFEGPPGSGKSSMATAIGEDLDMPIYSIDLTGMSNREFREAWKRVLCQTPCVVLLEDMDIIFNGRQNMMLGRDKPFVSFDCLLNSIDGAEGTDGILLVITTNDASKVDPALRDRPGRIDRIVKFGPLPEPVRRQIANRILSDLPDLADRAVREGDGEVGAAFTERCVRLAMMGFWREPISLDDHNDRWLEDWKAQCARDDQLAQGCQERNGRMTA
jgi:hypothetical protein